MLNVIYKYPFVNNEPVLVPATLNILKTDFENFWAFVDTEETEYVKLRCRVTGTGWREDEYDPNTWMYLDTQITEDGYVWHYFLVIEKEGLDKDGNEATE